MFLARFANFRVDRDSNDEMRGEKSGDKERQARYTQDSPWKASIAGAIVHIIVVLQFPPSESSSILVSLASR